MIDVDDFIVPATYLCIMCGEDTDEDTEICYECWPHCSHCHNKAESSYGGKCAECEGSWCETHQQVMCEECPGLGV